MKYFRKVFRLRSRESHQLLTARQIYLTQFSFSQMGLTGGGARSGGGTANPVKIVANIFISFIGAGVLGLPYAFKEAGYLQASVVMFLVALFSIQAMLMIVDIKDEILRNRRSRRRNNRQRGGGSYIKLDLPSPSSPPASSKSAAESLLPLIDSESDEGFADDPASVHSNKNAEPCLTYGDVGYYAFGLPGRALVDTTLTVSQFGFCCAYLIFITENLAKAELMSKAGWLVVLLPFEFALTLLRKLDKLAVFSLLAQVSNLLAFAVVFWFDFEHLKEHKFVHISAVKLSGFPLYLSVAIYCYEGQGLILALEDSLAPSIRHQFRRYFVVTLSAVTLLYIAFGASGYLSYGPETDEIITNNLPHTGGGLDSALLVKFCLCFALFFTYPIMLFPVFQLIQARSSFINGASREAALRCGVVSLTGFVVLAIPNFAHLMALIGATCCTLLAFILPAAFHLKIFGSSLRRNQRLFNYWLLVLGVTGAILGTTDTLSRMNEESAIAAGDLQVPVPQEPHDNDFGWSSQSVIVPSEIVPTDTIINSNRTFAPPKVELGLPDEPTAAAAAKNASLPEEEKQEKEAVVVPKISAQRVRKDGDNNNDEAPSARRHSGALPDVDVVSAKKRPLNL